MSRSKTPASKDHAPSRPLLRALGRAAPLICGLVGVLYPLAGIILYIVFRVRGTRDALRLAPLVGAVASLLMYVVEFAVMVAAQ